MISGHQGPYMDKESTNNVNISDVIEAWKKTIEVQQHFNEIEMKIRSLAITFLAAIVTASGFMIKESKKSDFLDNTQMNIFIIGAIVILLLFWMMDRLWYHKLLRGSVECGSKLEDTILEMGIDVKLTKTIKTTSAINIFGKRFDTSAKIDIFYFSPILFLLWIKGYYCFYTFQYFWPILIVSLTIIILVRWHCMDKFDIKK
jgi:hypothetical protein